MKLQRSIKTLSSLLCLILLIGCTPVVKKERIIIGAAASTQYVLKALIKAYEPTKNSQIESIISSSGKLTAQIEHGAPIDIFISADTLYPTYLFEKGLGLDRPVVYAYGKLVLWTMGNYDLSEGIKRLSSSEIHKIAIADPKTAPYGRLSQAYLEQNKLYFSIKEKLVLGESIGQVNQYINTEVVQIGLTAKSVVMAPELRGIGQFFELEGATLAQSMLLLKKEIPSAAAEAFYVFLQSSEAKKIFEAYGYSCGL